MKMVTFRIQYFLLRYGFHLLYHSMAWTYDWVAAIASAGKWETWIQTALPYINGPKVLELGIGPGHLQTDLIKQKILAFGIDESRQMTSIALRNIRHQEGQTKGRANLNRLVRGKVQSLPFAPKTFNTVISTFPSPYIFDPLTINEITRVLAPAGKVVIVLGAEITGYHRMEKISAWLMKVTHQSLSGQVNVRAPIFCANMRSEIIEIDLHSSRVLVMQAVRNIGEDLDVKTNLGIS
jgi:ubiquinone/menaquinone biosynthesis C-methylase UbiE